MRSGRQLRSSAPDCFLFHCWVIVGLRSAVGVRALAKEVRDLKNYSQYSYYQGEGEIAPKIDVPPSLITVAMRSCDGYHRRNVTSRRLAVRDPARFRVAGGTAGTGVPWRGPGGRGQGAGG